MAPFLKTSRLYGGIVWLVYGQYFLVCSMVMIVEEYNHHELYDDCLIVAVHNTLQTEALAPFQFVDSKYCMHLP